VDYIQMMELIKRFLVNARNESAGRITPFLPLCGTCFPGKMAPLLNQSTGQVFNAQPFQGDREIIRNTH
jgi:hypothetical protein